MIAVPRIYTQAASFTFIVFGLFLLTIGHSPSTGIACIGFSCWVLMISESMLHNKIQLEMSACLEVLRKKQAADIQDLLCFLRREKIAAAPYESVEGAKRLTDKIHYPAMVVSTNHQIIKANKKMHDLLGWDSKSMDLNGKPVYIINHPIVMSKLGALVGEKGIHDKVGAITKYVYVHKTGKYIYGQLDVTRCGVEGFFCVFHPEDQCLLSRLDIKTIVSNAQYLPNNKQQ